MHKLRLARGTPCPTNGVRFRNSPKAPMVLYGKGLYDPDGELGSSDPRFLRQLEENYARAIPLINPYLEKEYGATVGPKFGSGAIGTVYGLRPLSTDPSAEQTKLFNALKLEANKLPSGGGTGPITDSPTPVIKFTADEGEAAFVDFLLALRKNYEDPFHEKTTRPYPAMLPRFVDIISACPEPKKSYFIVREDIAGVGDWRYEQFEGRFGRKSLTERTENIYHAIAARMAVNRRRQGYSEITIPDVDTMRDIIFDPNESTIYLTDEKNRPYTYKELHPMSFDVILRGLVDILDETAKTLGYNSAFRASSDLDNAIGHGRKRLYIEYLHATALVGLMQTYSTTGYSNAAVVRAAPGDNVLTIVGRNVDNVIREVRDYPTWRDLSPEFIGPRAQTSTPSEVFLQHPQHYLSAIHQGTRSMIERLVDATRGGAGRYDKIDFWIEVLFNTAQVVQRICADAIDFWKFMYFNGISSQDLHIANWGIVISHRPRLVVRDLGFPLRAAPYASTLPNDVDLYGANTQLAGIIASGGALGAFHRYSGRARKPRITLRGVER